ncbi:hypothetical protein ACIRD3_12020 [Kitasatospora sp. NPDC093550]|uniref:hypothetical protein n=1 Tax=Kitasatospora sp. NPDC093550 TaxID=3364089 RepID=UPI0037F996C6
MPTASSGTNANAIATLFPASKGHTTVTKAKVPTTPLGQQNHKVVLLTAPPESSGSSAGTGVTLGAAHLPAGSFSLAGNACTGQTLQPGQTCPLEIVFAPTSVGTHSAELTVDTSAGRADYRVELTGEGVASASGSASPTHTSRTPVVTSPAESSPAEATATASEG